MTSLYLVRHGETQWNKENRCQGCTDIELNELGVRQAEAIAARLQHENIQAVYSSELKRAYDTAGAIARKLSLEVVKNRALNEINFGSWEGLTFEEMRQREDYDHNAWKSSPHKTVIPGEGSLTLVQLRAMSFINEIIKENVGKNILVVSHGGVLKCVILGLLGIGLEAYNKFFLANTSLSVILMDGERTFLKVLNDTCHLSQIDDTCFK